MNYIENLNQLTDEIGNKIGKPVNLQVVVAAIESMGVRAKDVKTDFGFVSINGLATAVFETLTNKEIWPQKGGKGKIKVYSLKQYSLLKLRFLLMYYPKGIFHLLPVLLQILSIVFFGYSLWTFIEFNQVQSTAVVLGVILGLVSSAGFVQVLGRQASFYWNHADFIMVKKVISYIQMKGIGFTSKIFGSLFVLNLLFNFYPATIMIIVMVYAVLIVALLLYLAPLHAIKKPWVISLAIAVGTSIALFLKIYSTFGIYITHWMGIATAVVFSSQFLKHYLEKKIQKQEIVSNLEIKPEVLFYHNYQYFIYGFFLYLFIFTDRILAWSTGINGPLPLLIYFEKNYEIGMDLAILMFLLLSGVLEYSIASFARFMDIGQKIYSYQNRLNFSSGILKMYKQNVALLLFSGGFIGALIYYVMVASWGYRGQFHEDLLQSSITICAIGSLGYLFLTWGILNTLYLFTLGKPSKPLKAIIVAFAVNFSIGFFASRFAGAEFSVVGMLLGAIVFMLLTLKPCLEFIKSLDYNYYAAY